MTPEGNQIGVSFPDNSLGTIRFESTCSDDSPFKNPTQSRCRDGRLTLCDKHVAFDPRFDDVKVRESELVQLFANMIEQNGWVTVRHGVPRAAGTNSCGNAISTPHRCKRFHYFDKETGPVLDRPPIGVSSLVAAILQEFIGQISIGGMKFDPVKTSNSRALCGFAII